MKQRPPTAKGFAFITMEDEEGIINVVIRPDVYERHRQICIFNPVLIVDGALQKRDGTLNVLAERIAPAILSTGESLPSRRRARAHPVSKRH